MDRRQFLKTLLLSSIALATAPMGFAKPGSSRTKKQQKVIVIGAGMSGLAAAHQLQRHGVNVTVLEARQRIGGRLHTDRTLGVPFERGAAWIHGPRGNPLTKLAKSVKADFIVTNDDALTVYAPQGTPISDAKLARLEDQLDDLLSTIDDEVSSTRQSLKSAIAALAPTTLQDPLIRWALASFVESDTGGPIEKLSAYYFDEDDGFSGDDVILRHGYDTILTPLAQGLDIRLNTLVQEISYQAPQGVSVLANNTTFSADAVICTLPLGVLQSGSVQFTPHLPGAYQQAIGAIKMGHLTKVALEFPTAFWPLKTQYFGHIDPIKGKWPVFMNYRAFSNHNILVAFASGQYTTVAERKTEAQLQQELMAILRPIFGHSIPNPQRTLVTRWSQDPYARGAYSYTGTGTLPKHYNVFEKPVANRVFFAGEHTTFDYRATLHGAYLSGIHAARAFLA